MCTHRLIWPRHPRPPRCVVMPRGVERGVRNVSLVNIEKIAKGLRKSLPELFRRT